MQTVKLNRSTVSQCIVCNKRAGQTLYNDAIHQNSPEHIFNQTLFDWNNSRKSLVKDRHGIQIYASMVQKKALQLVDNPKKGTYTVTLTSNQFSELNCSLDCMLMVVNNQKNDDISLIRVNLLHPNDLFTICDNVNNNLNNETHILKPKEKYTVKINFKLCEIALGSFTMPVAFSFQTQDATKSFTVVREIIVVISDETPKAVTRKTDSKKSPFTSAVWHSMVMTWPPTVHMRILNKYPIPDKYYKVLQAEFGEFRGMNDVDREHLRYILAKLDPNYPTPYNYADYFHFLLWLDEMKQMHMLRKYNMEKVTMTLIKQNTLVLAVPGLAEKRPSLIPGDTIHIRVTEDHTAYAGIVSKINNSTVEIDYVFNELTEYIYETPSIELDVAFQLGRLPDERMHNAVDICVKNGMLPALFPDETNLEKKATPDKYSVDDFFNKDIASNEEQSIAVNKILNSSSHMAPYIVFGPPGTGKTVTIVEAILQIKKHHTNANILVCAPANAACDMLTMKLMDHCTKDELIRVHSTTRDWNTVQKEVKGYSNYQRNKYIQIKGPELTKYRIVVTTLILCGKFHDKYFPDYVFIDEAAQAMEPEVDCAVSLMKLGKHLVLAGDPKQLGPSCASTEAEKRGLGVTLLERLMKTNKLYQTSNPNFIMKLKLNFRTHPSILKLPNILFYEGELKPVSIAALNDPIANVFIYPKIFPVNKANPGHPVEFCAVNAKERREGRSPSYFNELEIEITIKYIETLLNLETENNIIVKQSEIGVVTPYIRQVYRLKERLTQKNLKDVEVGTTETFQGREKRIIIISTVRAQHSLLLFDRKYSLGFVGNERRFNVAVTRAKSKLIVIGCPNVLSYDDKWLKFIEYCEELNAYFGPAYQKRAEQLKQEITTRLQNVTLKDTQYDN